jgi:hypothetical protein
MRKYDQYKQVILSNNEVYNDCVVISVSNNFVKFFGHHADRNLNVVKVVPRSYPLCNSVPNEILCDTSLVSVGENFRFMAQKHNDGWVLFRDVVVKKHDKESRKITFEGHQKEGAEYSSKAIAVALSYTEFNLTKVAPQDFTIDVSEIANLIELDNKNVPAEAIGQIQFDDAEDLLPLLGKAFNG